MPSAATARAPYRGTGSAGLPPALIGAPRRGCPSVVRRLDSAVHVLGASSEGTARHRPRAGVSHRHHTRFQTAVRPRTVAAVGPTHLTDSVRTRPALARPRAVGRTTWRRHVAGRGRDLRHGAPVPARPVVDTRRCRRRTRPVLPVHAPAVRGDRWAGPAPGAAPAIGPRHGRRDGNAGPPRTPAGGGPRGSPHGGRLRAAAAGPAVRAGGPVVRDRVRSDRVGDVSAGAGGGEPGRPDLGRLRRGADGGRAAARVRPTGAHRARGRRATRRPPGLGRGGDGGPRHGGAARRPEHAAVGSGVMDRQTGRRHARGVRGNGRRRIGLRGDVPEHHFARTPGRAAARPRARTARPAHPPAPAGLAGHTPVRGPLCALRAERHRPAGRRGAGPARPDPADPHGGAGLRGRSGPRAAPRHPAPAYAAEPGRRRERDRPRRGPGRCAG